MTTTNMEILVRARDEATGVLNRVGGTVSQTSGKFAAMGDKMTAVGSKLTRSVTPAAAAAAVVFAKAGKDWGDGVRAIRAGTGATGADLEKLTGIAKNVTGQVTASFDEVAGTLADLNTRTGASGKHLETLTKSFTDLSKITGESASTTIPAITRLFGDWSVKTKDQVNTMDYLYRASQATGIGVGQLSQQMVQFGSPLRQLGFTFDETAAMFAKFEKEGVNVQTALPGLRMALKNLSKPSDDLTKTMKKLGVTSKEPKDRLVELFDVIKKMPSTADANSLAFEVFGTRAGPDMAAAIREGRFELGDLIKQVKGGDDTIKKATRTSTTFGDKLTMLKNRFMTAIGPVGDVGAAVFGVAAAIGPALMGFGQMIPLIGKVGGAFKAVFSLLAGNPWMILIAALVVVVVLIVKHWDKVKAFLLKVWEAVKHAASVAWNAIKKAAIAVWNALKAPVIAYINFYKAVFRVAISVARTVWNAIKSVVTGAFRGIKSAASTVFGWFNTAWNKIKSVAIGVWNGIVGAVKTALNGVITIWNNTIGRIAHGQSYGVGPLHLTLPDLRITPLAEGGLVTKPTLSLVGEAGPEAVIPLRKMRGLGMGNVSVGVNIDRRRWVDEADFQVTYGGV